MMAVPDSPRREVYRNLYMKKFYTKYDMQDIGYDGCIMNPVDAVDRLSYVDSTQQIVRMLNAGANLRMRNNQGYQSDDFNAPSMPVYTPDVADAQKRIKFFNEELKESASRRSAEFEANRNRETTEKKVDPSVTRQGDD